MAIITEFELALNVADVLRGQGIDPSRARADLRAAAESVLDELKQLLTPAACYRVVTVEAIDGDIVRLDGGVTWEGPLVARGLTGARAAVRAIAVAVCTIGPALEGRVSEYFAAGDAVRAMALDGAGIAALGQISQAVQKRMDIEASARGWRTGMVISPGQEGWPLIQQHEVFQLVPAPSIGVRLTESCLMIPRKSISFAVGMGTDLCADATSCDFCSKQGRCGWRAREVVYGTT